MWNNEALWVKSAFHSTSAVDLPPDAYSSCASLNCGCADVRTPCFLRARNSAITAGPVFITYEWEGIEYR